jgi:hypothetical protein
MQACAIYRTGQAMYYNATLRHIHLTTGAVEKQ